MNKCVKDVCLACKPLIIFAAALLAVSVAFSFANQGSITSWLSLSFAILLFYIPGYCVLLNLDIDVTSRLAFAFLSGLMLVSLCVYFLNWAGIKLSQLSVGIVALCIALVSLFAFIVWSLASKKVSMEQQPHTHIVPQEKSQDQEKVVE